MNGVERTVVIGACIFLTSVVAASASAAIYEVHACRLPSGAPAPAHGWTTTSVFGPGAVSQINCPGGAMTSQPAAGEHNKGYLLGFSFTAPAGTTIAGYSRAVEAVVDTPGAPPPWRWQYGEFATRVGAAEPVAIAGCDNCGVYIQTMDYRELPGRFSQIYSALRCDSQTGPGPCQANGSHFLLRWISVGLEDLKPPRVVSASGSLLDNSVPQRGERVLSLRLQDVGGGLLTTRVEVDAQRFGEQGIDGNDGRCKRPFVAPVPCKLAANVELPIDTTRLADGHHAITVRVFDATGVNSTLFGPIPIDVDNVPDPRPSKLTCPSRVDGRLTRRARTKVARFGGMTSVSGRIAGRIPLRGARVALVDPSGTRATAGTARVRHGGRFRLQVRPRRSQRVRPMLLSASGVPQLCGAPIRLRVRAGVKFAVAPKRLVNGESIRMTGRLLGHPVPDVGKTIVIQARARGAATWTRVSVIPVGSSGRFTFTYRFRRTFRSTAYEFRALSPRQRDYPFARGWSRVRRAFVMP